MGKNSKFFIQVGKVNQNVTVRKILRLFIIFSAFSSSTLGRRSLSFVVRRKESSSSIGAPRNRLSDGSPFSYLLHQRKKRRDSKNPRSSK